MHAPGGANSVTGFAVVDLALPLVTHQDRMAVEVADHVPDVVGPLFEHGAVIGFGHGTSSVAGFGNEDAAPGGQNPPDIRCDGGLAVPAEPIEICGQAAI